MLQEYVKTLEARPLRTFRTEFNIYDTIPELVLDTVVLVCYCSCMIKVVFCFFFILVYRQMV